MSFSLRENDVFEKGRPRRTCPNGPDEFLAEGKRCVLDGYGKAPRMTQIHFSRVERKQSLLGRPRRTCPTRPNEFLAKGKRRVLDG